MKKLIGVLTAAALTFCVAGAAQAEPEEEDVCIKAFGGLVICGERV